MMTGRFKRRRRLIAFIEAAVIIGLPFLRINGESALRFDIPSLQLHFFGLSIWMEEFFIVLTGIIFITLLFVLVTLLFGRVWCGWACPQTVLSDLISSVDKASGRDINDKALPWAFTLIVSVIVSADLIWYFVSPYDFFHQLFSMRMGSVVQGFWIALTLIIFFDLIFLRQRFCATVCPYSMLQGVFFDSRTLTVAFDPRRKDECIGCRACIKACPVGIDIRQGAQRACIHCAKCIDECGTVMAGRGRKTLIDYFRGMPGESGGLLRRNTVIFGAATFIFLAFFLYMLAIRTPFGLTILPNYDFTPRISDTGEATNSYLLSITNRSRADMVFEARASTAGGIARLVPDSDILVRAGAAKKIPVYITVRKTGNESVTEVEISIMPKVEDAKEVNKKAGFWFGVER